MRIGKEEEGKEIMNVGLWMLNAGGCGRKTGFLFRCFI